jgi:hypothetical protein
MRYRNRECAESGIERLTEDRRGHKVRMFAIRNQVLPCLKPDNC